MTQQCNTSLQSHVGNHDVVLATSLLVENRQLDFMLLHDTAAAVLYCIVVVLLSAWWGGHDGIEA